MVFWVVILGGYIAPMDGKWPVVIVWIEHYIEPSMLAGAFMLILASLWKQIKDLRQGRYANET